MDLMAGGVPLHSPESGFLFDFFGALNVAGVRYAVMRNYDSLPHSLEGSDLDILVAPEDQKSLRDILVRSIERSNAIAIGCSPVHRFFKVCMIGRNRTTNKSWWGLCIDVNVGVSFKGIEIVGMTHIGEYQRVYKAIQVLTPDLAAVLGVIKELLNNGNIPERYLRGADRAMRADWPGMNRILQPMGEQSVSIIRDLILRSGNHAHEAAQEKKLRRSLFWQSFIRSPSACLKGRILYEWSKVRRYLQPSGVVVAVLGVDGVGKSTVISAIEPVLREATHGTLEVKHLRPGLLPPLARLKGRQIEKMGPVLDPHGSKPSGLIGSLVRLIYLTTDYVLGYWLSLRPTIAKNPTVVLFDRYCYDMALDPRRFRIGLKGSVVDWFLRLIPKPDVVLCLHAEPDAIALRKQELPIEEISRQVEGLHKFAQGNPHAVLVSTEGTPEEVRDRVLEALLSFFAQRGNSIHSHD